MSDVRVTGRAVREAERARMLAVERKHYIWACQACGPCETSRGDWCDRGCGSDYNSMVKLSRYMLDKVKATARAEGHAAGLEEAAKACELWATARGAACADGIRALSRSREDK